ncbi:hypothetical protein PI126_g13036 [Phytophthora idaei]|nr:hypothetical protein PI126_g13036 [Phytophthora idaei]
MSTVWSGSALAASTKLLGVVVSAMSTCEVLYEIDRSDSSGGNRQVMSTTWLR